MNKLIAWLLVFFGMTSSAWGQATVWPPSNYLNVGVTVRLETRQVWTGTVTGLKRDTVQRDTWAVDLRGANGATAELSYFASNEDNTFFFQARYKSGNDNAFEYCQIDPADKQPDAGVYSGKRSFLANFNAAVVRDGACRVTVSVAPVSQTGPLVWPPSKLFKIGVPVTISGRQSYAGKFTSGPAADGRWIGQAMDKNAGTVILSANPGDIGSLHVFQVDYLNRDQKTSSEFCVLEQTAAQVASGVYAGKRYYRADEKAGIAIDGVCRVTIGAVSSAAPQPSTGLVPVPVSSQLGAKVWPPSDLLKAGVALRVETRQIWTGSLVSKDSDDVWTGKMTGANGARGNVAAYEPDDFSTEDELYEFQIVYSSGSVEKFEFCTLYKSNAQVASGVYVGMRSYAEGRDDEPVGDGQCKVTIGSAQTVTTQTSPPPVSPVSPPPVSTAQTPATSDNPFAAGQTWSATFEGFGTWVTKLSDTVDILNNRVGSLISGPYQGSAYVKLVDGKPQLFVSKQNDFDNLVCTASSSVAQNGVYSGTTVEKKLLEEKNLGTPCSFKLLPSAQSATSSQVGTVVWPPSALLKENVTLRIETHQVWTGSDIGKNNNRLYTASDIRGNLYAYGKDDGTYEFQVAYKIGSVEYFEYCKLKDSASQVAPGVYVGTGYYQVGRDTLANIDGGCKVTIVTTQTAPQPSTAPVSSQTVTPIVVKWPPSNLLEVGTVVGVETRSVWIGRFTGRDNSGWVGDVSATSGTDGRIYAYLNDDSTYEFQVVSTTNGVTQYEFCTLQNTASQGVAGTYRGKRYFQASESADVVPDGDCRVLIGSGASLMKPTFSQVTPPAPKPIAVPNIKVWPFQIAVGQQWQIEVQGFGVWRINFDALNATRAPTGLSKPTNAGATLTSEFVYSKENDDVRLLLSENGKLKYRCIFEQSAITSLTFKGWLYVPSSGNNLQKTTQSCTMSYLGAVTVSVLLEPLTNLVSR